MFVFRCVLILHVDGILLRSGGMWTQPGIRWVFLFNQDPLSTAAAIKENASLHRPRLTPIRHAALTSNVVSLHRRWGSNCISTCTTASMNLLSMWQAVQFSTMTTVLQCPLVAAACAEGAFSSPAPVSIERFKTFLILLESFAGSQLVSPTWPTPAVYFVTADLGIVCAIGFWVTVVVTLQSEGDPAGYLNGLQIQSLYCVCSAAGWPAMDLTFAATAADLKPASLWFFSEKLFGGKEAVPSDSAGILATFVSISAESTVYWIMNRPVSVLPLSFLWNHKCLKDHTTGQAVCCTTWHRLTAVSLMASALTQFRRKWTLTVFWSILSCSPDLMVQQNKSKLILSPDPLFTPWVWRLESTKCSLPGKEVYASPLSYLSVTVANGCEGQWS